MVSNPRKTRAIAEAKVKTDKVDARILAQLLAADFLPGTWVADDRTRMLRRLVMRRTHLVKQRTRLKNQVHGILARNLVPTCPHADLFSGVGRRWLAAQDLPADEWRSVDALVRQLDFHGDELAGVERDIALEAIDDPIVARLMTVPGIDVTVADRRSSPRSATSPASTAPTGSSSYLGLNPRVRQSGNGPAVHGRITKAGPAQARGMLVEAAFSASRAPGPLRAFYRRVKDRRGFQVATVATARKMTVLCWHLDHQRRGLRLRPPQPQRPQAPQARTRRRRRIPHAGPSAGPSHDYHIKQLRDQEKAIVEHAERAYEVTRRPLATPTTRRHTVDNLIRACRRWFAARRGTSRNGTNSPQAVSQVSIMAG